MSKDERPERTGYRDKNTRHNIVRMVWWIASDNKGCLSVRNNYKMKLTVYFVEKELKSGPA